MKILLATVLSLSFGGFAHAQPAFPAACAALVAQCQAAGFNAGKNSKKRKGLWIGCVRRIAKGRAIRGITISKQDARACQEAKRNEGRSEVVRQNDPPKQPVISTPTIAPGAPAGAAPLSSGGARSAN